MNGNIQRLNLKTNERKNGYDKHWSKWEKSRKAKDLKKWKKTLKVNNH